MKAPKHARQALKALFPVITILVFAGALRAQALPPLQQEAILRLPDVKGRIDHMSVDVSGKRLFVSALGNDSLEIIDTDRNQRLHSITALSEPQGVLYEPVRGRIFVANANDGTVRLYNGKSLAQFKVISYGSDADNIRYDAGTGHIYVGYGEGALGELDQDGNRLSDIKLDAHPESFQLEKNGQRIFVNLPDSRKIAVVDRKARKVVAEWPMGDLQKNFPMAFDEADQRLFVVTRQPPRLVVIDSQNGHQVTNLPAVGDCDDVFFDAQRKRIYATGGEGAITVFEQQSPDHYVERARISTRAGARTGIFSPDLNHLYLAVPRRGGQPAELRVYRPNE